MEATFFMGLAIGIIAGYWMSAHERGAKSGVEMGKVNRVETGVLRKLLERGKLKAEEFIEYGGISRREALGMWAIKVGEVLEASAETGGEKTADEQFKGMATDEKYQAETLKIEKEFAQSDWEALLASDDWLQFHRDPDNGAGLHALFIDGTPIHHFKSHQRPAPYIQRVRDAVKRVAERLANFPRTSQNQTASSGVEGAHAGTTADKWPNASLGSMYEHPVPSEPFPSPRESREPEKPISLQPISDETKKFVALAESSLSSPPPDYVELAKRERFAFTDNLEREIALRGGCGFDFDQLQNVRAIALTAYARAVSVAASPELLPTQRKTDF